MWHRIIGLPSCRFFSSGSIFFQHIQSRSSPLHAAQFMPQWERVSKQGREHPCMLSLIFITEFINDGHVWVILNKFQTGLNATRPSWSPRQSNYWSFLKKHPVPRNICEWKCISMSVSLEHKVDLQGVAVSDKAFKKLAAFQILIYMIINTDLLQIYQSV